MERCSGRTLHGLGKVDTQLSFMAHKTPLTAARCQLFSLPRREQHVAVCFRLEVGATVQCPVLYGASLR